MAKPSLKLDRLIDGEALRRDLAALAISANGAESGATIRQAVLQALKGQWAFGRKMAEAMLGEDGSGTACAARRSRAVAASIRTLYAPAATQVYRMRNPSAGRRMAVGAVGGHGRGQLAQGS